VLHLTIRDGESVMIGDDVEIIVATLPGRRVQLRFNAPRWIKILRKELWQRDRSISSPSQTGSPNSAPPTPLGGRFL
jgi:carbon storage regulator CsrA